MPSEHALSEIHLLQNYLLIGAILFGVGLVGFLSTVALARYLSSRSPASAAAETGEGSE